MKIRSNYVSNSSSSSFVIAYDEKFFGNLLSLFKGCYLGCETYIRDIEDFYKMFQDDKERVQYLNKITKLQDDGKKVIYLSLDTEYLVLAQMLKSIGDHNIF